MADVFVHIRRTGKTTRVSVGPAGEANDVSGGATVSINGRRVAFDSFASNVGATDTNEAPDVYVQDRRSDRTALVSVSKDGRAGNGYSADASLSKTGRLVAFQSAASNLVARDRNQAEDIFVRDLRRGRTELVSIGPDGRQLPGFALTPSISPNGRYVAFKADADRDEHAEVYLRDRRRDRTTMILGASGADGGHFEAIAPELSGNGRFLAFTTDAAPVKGDTNTLFDVYRLNVRTGAIVRVTKGTGGSLAGTPTRSAISRNGRRVAFASTAGRLVRATCRTCSSTTTSS